MYRTYSAYDAVVLNTDTTVKATDPNSNEFGHTTVGNDAEFIVVQRIKFDGTRGGMKLLSSNGNTDWTPGQDVRLQADQTGRDLGLHVVVAIVAESFTAGVVPARKLPYYVFK